ncbi:MAG: magnesium and cobalt transport protein CorA [Rubrobacteraceae bacterium]|nr:magnesium and cobalt transport protein CorA [Rubrobacteraceae bacterium]
MIADSAIYVDGERTESPGLEGIRHTCHERGGFVWVGLVEPDDEELASVAREFGLPEKAVRDAVKAHHRPRLDHYGEAFFVVLRTARYLDQEERVEFGEILIFLGRDYVVTIWHGKASSLEGLRKELEGHSGFLGKGTGAVLWAVVDRVVDGYEPVIDGLENDVDEIEEEVFGGNADVSRRIYELSREVLEFLRAVQPLAKVLERLSDESYGVDREVLRRMRGVNDHVLRVTERVDGFRELLSNILSVNLTIVSVQQNAAMQRQNVQVQKISAWAAILAVPTLISGVYGMNFRYMPELGSILGYPYALALMISISGLLYLGFKRAGWL